LFLVAGGRYLVLPSGTLLIANSTRRDSGSYHCVAYNPVADVRSTSPVTHRLLVTPAGQKIMLLLYAGLQWDGNRLMENKGIEKEGSKKYSGRKTQDFLWESN